MARLKALYEKSHTTGHTFADCLPKVETYFVEKYVNKIIVSKLVQPKEHIFMSQSFDVFGRTVIARKSSLHIYFPLFTFVMRGNPKKAKQKHKNNIEIQVLYKDNIE